MIGVAQAPWVSVTSVAFAVALAVGWIQFGLPGRLRREYKTAVPEARTNYSPESVNKFLAWIGTRGIALYRLELGWDILFAISFGGLLTLAARGLLLPHIHDGSRWRLVLWVPALYAVLDVLEDLLLLYAVPWPPDNGKPIPEVSRGVVSLARWVTRGKYVSVVTSGALILVGGGLQADSVPPQPPVNRQAIFDYSMPAGFGFDANGDGLTDYMDTGRIQQTSFTLNLTACETKGSIGSYNWTIEGTPEGRITEHSADCHLSLDLPEGTYPVTLSVRWRDGVVRIVGRPVTVQDWLIVSAGDSFASGQGAPQKSSGPIPHWQETSCARSADAGAAQAALALEQEDPRTSVTFVHVACSGATVQNGMLDPQEPDSAGDIGESQLETIRRDVGSRTIDALVVSIGGNDIGFASIIGKCLIPLLRCGTQKRTDDVTRLLHQLTDVGGAIDILSACLSSSPSCPAETNRLLASPSHILVTPYPDMTQRWKKGGLRDCNYLGISRADFAWAREDVLEPLNSQLRAAWERSGATFLRFPRDLWAIHGICAGDRWFNKLSGSYAVELSRNGAFHPNQQGYAIGYQPVILAGLHRAGIGPTNASDG